MSKKLLKNSALAVVAGAAVFSVAGMASADVYSYEGDDYSVDRSSGAYVQACDRETDGNSVIADYYRNGWNNFSAIKNTQGNGTCGATASHSDKVDRHRIVEDGILYLHGPWRSTGY